MARNVRKNNAGTVAKGRKRPEETAKDNDESPAGGAAGDEETPDETATDETDDGEETSDEDEQESDDEDDDETEDSLKDDIRWLKETMTTMLAGAEDQRQQQQKKPRRGRTVVRVRESEPKTPPEPVRQSKTKKLGFGGFGLRKARRM